jgi:hypothetical protein
MNQPTFHPTDDGLTDAISRFRRRRTRRHAAAASASGTALAVAAFAVLAGQGPSPDSLRQQQPFGPAGPAADRPASGAPAASAAPGSGTRQSPTDAAVNMEAGPVPGPGGQQRPASGRGGAPMRSADTVAPRPQPAVMVSTPVERTTTAYEPNRPCADTSGRAAGGWCMQVDVPRSGVTGQPVDLAVSLCRLPGFGAARASFPTTAEAGFVLGAGQGGGTVWDHALQHPGRSARHERQVQGGDCLSWTTTWFNRDSAGDAIAPGAYELRLSVLTDNITEPNTAVTQNYYYTVEAEQ